MNLYELQERANKLVELVNEFESNIPDEEGDENELIAQHKFADIYCLRSVMQYILGNGEERKSNTTLNNSLPIIQTVFNNTKNYNTKGWLLPSTSVKSISFKDYLNTNDLELYKAYEINQYLDTSRPYTNIYCPVEAVNKAYGYTYNLYVSGDLEDSARIGANTICGFNTSTGVNIQDAMLTESQVTNLINLKYEYYFPIESVRRNDGNKNLGQPHTFGGIILFSAPNYNRNYHPNIPNRQQITSGLNSIVQGSVYLGDNNTDYEVQSQGLFISQDDGHSYKFKTFINCNTLAMGESYILPVNQLYGTGAPYAGYKDIKLNSKPERSYFELVFKRRRKGCKENNLDFVPAVDTSFDNDPQGLATRLALAQCKPYYYKRPWFTELNVYYTDNGEIQTKLADLIEEESKEMDDLTFIKTYKLNYETYAKATGDPL